MTDLMTLPGSVWAGARAWKRSTTSTTDKQAEKSATRRLPLSPEPPLLVDKRPDFITPPHHLQTRERVYLPGTCHLPLFLTSRDRTSPSRQRRSRSSIYRHRKVLDSLRRGNVSFMRSINFGAILHNIFDSPSETRSFDPQIHQSAPEMFCSELRMAWKCFVQKNCDFDSPSVFESILRCRRGCIRNVSFRMEMFHCGYH